MPKISEWHIQRAVCIHLAAYKMPGVEFWHTPNGGARSAIEGKRFKDTGVMPGVHDLLFFYVGRLFILELKDADGVLSAEQESWRDRMVAQGAIAGWANSLAVARAQIHAWGLTSVC